MLALKVIGRPRQAHSVRSPVEYARKQHAQIKAGRQKHRFLEWRDPVEVPERLTATVSGGWWVVRCACGNAPSADPDWRVARCFECGAVYVEVVFPADREQGEAVLLLRPNMHNRHWLTAETVKDLLRENIEHGDPVPDTEWALALTREIAAEPKETS